MQARVATASRVLVRTADSGLSLLGGWGGILGVAESLSHARGGPSGQVTEGDTVAFRTPLQGTGAWL